MMIAEIAAALLGAQRPLVVSGASCRSPASSKQRLKCAWALRKAGRPANLSFSTRVQQLWSHAGEPRPLSEAFRSIQSGPKSTLIVLENDFSAGARKRDAALLHRRPTSVALDHLVNATTESAELVLPAGTFSESDGTLVNSEGRAQRFFQVLVPAQMCRRVGDGCVRLRGCGLQRRDAMAERLTTSSRRWRQRCRHSGHSESRALAQCCWQDCSRTEPLQRPHRHARQH